MPYLTGNHVHFIVERDGDQHIRIGGTGACQHIRMRAMTDNGSHIQRIRNLLDELRRLVDDCHIVLFRRKLFGDTEADLTRTADDDFHFFSLLVTAAMS